MSEPATPYFLTPDEVELIADLIDEDYMRTSLGTPRMAGLRALADTFGLEVEPDDDEEDDESEG